MGAKDEALLEQNYEWAVQRARYMSLDGGRLIISPVAHHPSLLRMGIDPAAALNVGSFTDGQKHFLDFHRNQILLRAHRP